MNNNIRLQHTCNRDRGPYTLGICDRQALVPEVVTITKQDLQIRDGQAKFAL
jgi:hypothetical protein